MSRLCTLPFVSPENTNNAQSRFSKPKCWQAFARARRAGVEQRTPRPVHSCLAADRSVVGSRVTETIRNVVGFASDRHGPPSTGRRRVVRGRPRERHQTAGIVAERLQVPVHGDEEEVPADQRSTCRARGVVVVFFFAPIFPLSTRPVFPFFQASEEAIVKLRNSAAVATEHLQQQQQHALHHHHQIYYVVNQILYPIVQGCETKEPKIVKVCSVFFFLDNDFMKTSRAFTECSVRAVCLLVDVFGNHSEVDHTPGGRPKVRSLHYRHSLDVDGIGNGTRQSVAERHVAVNHRQYCSWRNSCSGTNYFYTFREPLVFLVYRYSLMNFRGVKLG